ncbi:ribosomal protein S18-alanine N-acetyltransferase [Neptunomonas japonica]|nr:ribosomal protein S18-alanine N-acetyltransferase [Neptunomonas japonica]
MTSRKSCLPMVEFSLLCEGNIASIMPIETRLFAEECWSEGQVKSQLNNPRCLNLAVSISKELLGFVLVSSVLDEAELYQIAILPKAQGLGLATSLLHELVNRLKDLGITRLMLEVRETNTAAVKLYTSFGFVLDGCRKGYYTSLQGREDALLYSYQII